MLMRAYVLEVKVTPSGLMWRNFSSFDGTRIERAEISKKKKVSLLEPFKGFGREPKVTGVLIFSNEELTGLQKINTPKGAAYLSKSLSFSAGKFTVKNGTPVEGKQSDTLKAPKVFAKMNGTTAAVILAEIEKAKDLFLGRAEKPSYREEGLWFGYGPVRLVAYSLIVSPPAGYPILVDHEDRRGKLGIDVSQFGTAVDVWNCAVSNFAEISEIEEAVHDMVESLSEAERAHFWEYNLSLYLPRISGEDRVRVWSIRKGWANVTVARTWGSHVSYKSDDTPTPNNFAGYDDED